MKRFSLNFNNSFSFIAFSLAILFLVSCSSQLGQSPSSSTSAGTVNSASSESSEFLGDSSVDIVDGIDSVSGGTSQTTSSGDTIRNLTSTSASAESSNIYTKRIPLMNVVWLSYRNGERNRIAFIVDKNEVMCGLVPNTLTLYYLYVSDSDVRVRLAARAYRNAICPAIYAMNPQVYIYRMSNTFRNKNIVFNQGIQSNNGSGIVNKSTYTRLNWYGNNLISPATGAMQYHQKTVNFDHRSSWGNPYGVRSEMATLSPHQEYYSSGGKILFSEVMVSGIATSECPGSATNVRCEGGRGDAVITIYPRYKDSQTVDAFEAAGYSTLQSLDD